MSLRILLCRIGIHRWTIWSDPAPSLVSTTGDYLYLFQLKRCRECGRCKTRYL